MVIVRSHEQSLSHNQTPSTQRGFVAHSLCVVENPLPNCSSQPPGTMGYPELVFLSELFLSELFKRTVSAAVIPNPSVFYAFLPS